MSGNNQFSMSLSSVTSRISNNSTISASSYSSSKKYSVKHSPEYRALRQQLFQLQSSHSSLKLVHEKEMILAAGQKANLIEQVQKLQEQLDEIKKDQVYLLNSEKEAVLEVERVKTERDTLEQSFKSNLQQLELQLQAEREARYTAENELTKLKMQTELGHNSHYDEEFVTNILAEWKEKVITLTKQNHSLEEELENIKSNIIKTTSNDNILVSNDNCEELRQKILSTYVSLEQAQSVLAQKRAEADRLAFRIGNVKILEEKYRDAQIRIKRLESELLVNDTEKPASYSPAPSLASSSSASDLKLVQLTQEIGNLKESLATATLNYSTLQSELENSNTLHLNLQQELEEAKRSVAKLQNSLKVKDATISNLKEQLDSTVNLLTETLKKKK